MGVLKLGDFLRLAEGRLQESSQSGNARRDAEFLLGHVLGRDRSWLLTNRNADLNRLQMGTYEKLLERRAAGEPIQYIVGETEFYGLPFAVTPDVLIPRPETEHLVEKAIELAGRFDEPRIVDVGTGSGAIAVALAYRLPGARMTAIDLSPRALAVARANAEKNGVAEQIRLLQGDLLDSLAGERFEMVVSNPPYVPAADRASLAVEVREHEPALALFAGDDGLDVIRRLAVEASAALVPGGGFLMEFGYGQRPAVCQLLEKAGFVEIDFIADLQGIPRVAVGRRP
jgi:release factor glutamine methyltransferase